jgi:hypothetical protein
MQRLFILALLGLFASIAAYSSFAGLQQRVAQLESAPRFDPQALRAVSERILRDEERVANALAELERLRNTPELTQALDQRLQALSHELGEAACTLSDQRLKLAEWDGLKDELGPRALDARVAEYRLGVENQFQQVDELAQTALGLARGTRTELDRVEQDLSRDTDRMWSDLVGPTVQLMGEDTVGSGVLLPSEHVAGTEDYRTLLVTAWHVIRDIQGGADRTQTPVAVTIYAPDKTTTAETAELLEHDAELDVALLVLQTKRPIECGAKLPSRERLLRARIFDRIYAVGCPLGNDPIPTYGEVSDTHHMVDGQRYWMISAPTYIGNSGGGIFDARTHELLGIFSKIYTHGSVRPTVVPHMGLATSMLSIYDWLDKVGYASLEPPSEAVRTQTAAAPR